LYPSSRKLQALGLLLSAGILSLFFSESAFPQRTNPQTIRIQQGQAFYLRLNLADPARFSHITFRDKIIPLFSLQAKGAYGALIGIDLAEEPARYELTVQGSDPSASDGQRYVVEVVSANFGVQELTLPRDQVELDEETLKRVEEEQEKILQSLKPVTTERLWEGKFIPPVEGTPTGSFGRKRIINGEPRSPHSGEDFSVPQGTAVRAANTGRVALVGEYFFSGKSIIIDHGLGCYTMYFHLHDIRVKEGDRVEKGTVIGSVGATGRATGPHLHWGARINGARVNPVSIVELEELPSP
jgi:murein DD-endopeptidase MepM/ murein hydrolase activator NlpD